MNLSETWQTWLHVITAPGEPTFETERQKPQATLTTALIWMLIAGVVAAILGFIQAAVAAGAAQGTIGQIIATADLPPETRAALEQLLNSGVLGILTGGASLTSIIMVPIGFLVSTAIYFVIAKLLGGTGDFGRYAYLNASFGAPLAILSSILSVIPFLGCITIFLGHLSNRAHLLFHQGRAQPDQRPRPDRRPAPADRRPAACLLFCLLCPGRLAHNSCSEQLTRNAYD